jgi:Fe(3+) dicitrate transport protein
MLHAADIKSSGFKTISGERADTGFHKTDFLAKASLAIGLDELFVKLGQTDEQSNETYLGLTEDDFNQNPYDRYAASALDNMDNRHRQLQLGYLINRNSFSIRTTAYYHTFDRLWYKFNGLSGAGLDASSVISEPYGRNQHAYDVIKGADDSLGANDQIVLGSNDRSYRSYGLDVKAEHQLPDAFLGDHTIEWGLRFHGDSIRRDHQEEPYLMSLGKLVTVENQPAAITTQNEDSAKALSAFVIDTMKIARLRINVGLRLEKVELSRTDELDRAGNLDSAREELIPGAGLFYLIDESFGAFFGVNRGLALASIDDVGSGKPEQSINYELGLRYKKKRAAADLVGFYSDYSNIKGTCSFSSGCSSQDIDKSFDGGKAKVYGLELSSSYTGLWGGFYWPISMQYTYTHGVFENRFVSSLADWGIGIIEPNDPLPYIPKHQASLNLGIKGSRAQFMASYRYVSEKFDQAAAEGRKRMDHYRVVDLSVSVWPYKQAPYELYMTADNVLKSRYLVSYRPFGARPGKPQSFSFGVKASL